MNPKTKVKFRSYLKNNPSAHGSVAKRLKMYCSSRFQRDSAFSPLHDLDSRDFAKLNLPFLNPNLISEIASSICYHNIKSVTTHHAEGRLCGTRLG